MVVRYTLTQREKILIRIFVLLILVGGLYQLCYNYTWLNIKKIKIAIENEKKSLEAIRNTVSKKEKIKKEYAKIETRLKSMINREQVDIRTGSSWLQIGKLLQKHRLELISLTPQPIEDKGHFLQLPLQIEIEGKYIELIGYINSLENLSNAWFIENVVLKANEDDDNMYASIQAIVFGSKNKDKIDFQKWLEGLADLQEMTKETDITNPNDDEESSEIQHGENVAEFIFEEKYSFPVKIGGKQ